MSRSQRQSQNKPSYGAAVGKDPYRGLLLCEIKPRNVSISSEFLGTKLVSSPARVILYQVPGPQVVPLNPKKIVLLLSLLWFPRIQLGHL